MREYLVPTLILLFLPSTSAQVVPSGWKIVKDPKRLCQIAVPPDWSPYGDNMGAAVFQDVSTAIATVTSQPGQEFEPLSESLQKLLGIPTENMFENTAKRIFYREQTSRNRDDPDVYSFAAPGKAGTCSGHLRSLPSISEEVARKIALSLGPAAQPGGGSY